MPLVLLNQGWGKKRIMRAPGRKIGCANQRASRMGEYPLSCQSISNCGDTKGVSLEEGHIVPLPRLINTFSAFPHSLCTNSTRCFPRSTRTGCRNTGNPVLQDALTTKPHLVLSVEALPTQVDLHEIGLRSIGKSVCRPDGLRQLYVMADATDSFFMELNTQDQTCKRDTKI